MRTWCRSRLGLSTSSSRSTSGAPHSPQRIAFISCSSPYAYRSCRRYPKIIGGGQRAFTVGADVSGDLSAGPEVARMVNHALLKNDPYSKPIVAAVNGDCVGGGLELMLSTDIRAAAPEARFGLTEVKWSIYPFGGSTINLIQQIGYVHAMDLLLTARLIDAGEAARLGLVNRLAPRSQPMGWAIETAGMIAANSPSAVQAVQRAGSAPNAEYPVAPPTAGQQHRHHVAGHT